MKSITLIITLLISFNSFCKNYIPIPLDNSGLEWRSFGNAVDGLCGVNYRLYEYTAGDTVINSLSYKIIKKDGPYSISPTCGANLPNGIEGCVRQDTITRKVYIVVKDSSYEEVLYDFSLTVGDTVETALERYSWYNDPSDPFVVIAVDSMLINGVYHRYLDLNKVNNPTFMPFYFIEGIGCSAGFIYPYVTFEMWMKLECLTDSANILYSDPISFICTITDVENKTGIETMVFPNPNNGTFTIQTNSSYNSILIFDMQARKIKELYFEYAGSSHSVCMKALNPGIYFLQLSNDEVVLGQQRVIITE